MLLSEDLDHLGRRNLTRDQRDALIKRLAASGVRQKDIAERTGLPKQTVSDIVRESGNRTETRVNTTTAAQELQAKQAEVEALRRQVAAAKEAESRVRSRHLEVLEDLETHKRELRRLQAAPPQVAERVVEVVKEVPVIPPEVQERIAALEKEQSRVTPPTTEKPDQTPTAKAIAQGLLALHAAAQEGGLGDIATVLWRAATQVEELMRRPAA